MATFAGVEVRSGCELACVLVLMTVSAVLKLHFENGIDATRDVTFLASHFGMRALQRICGGGVIRDRKC